MSNSFEYIESVERTDIGCKRKNNEDSLISLPAYGVYCVADGMGGAQDGEVASQAVVDTLEERFVSGSDSAYAVTAAASAKIVAMALNKASSWIEQRSHNRGIQGSGSTAMVMVFDKVMPDKAMIVHAGDSRAYRFRRKKLTQVTTDHSVASEAGVADENDLPPMLRGVITRAVGLKPQVEVEETPVDIEPGDIYLLCSDGLSRMVSDKKMASIFKKKSRGELQVLVDALVDEALRQGGKDNISVILMRMADELPSGPLMEVSDETRRLENMAFNVSGDDMETGDTAGSTGETVAVDTAHSAEDVLECSTPSGDTDEHGLATPTDNAGGAAGGGKAKMVMIIVGLVVVIAVVAFFLMHKG